MNTAVPHDLIVLRAPSANRVYTAAAGPMMEREACTVLSAHLGVNVRAKDAVIGGMQALALDVPDSDDALLDRAARVALTLSGTLGVMRPEQGDLLRVLDPVRPERWPSDLETTLRYPGKTNEQFTALLLNLAAAASTRRSRLFEGDLRVLDPMCGRGTTLNRALRLGLSPTGADIDKGDHEAYRAFLLTWLKNHRIPHTSAPTRLSVHGRVLGSRFDASFAADRAALKHGGGQKVVLLRCDTGELADVLSHESMDVIVCDLPYGVQHGSHGDDAVRRSPAQLLARALPTWRSLLRRGGAMALAINRHTMDAETVRQVLDSAGMRALTADGEFRHRVDQSIDRDVVVAVRDDHPGVPGKC